MTQPAATHTITYTRLGDHAFAMSDNSTGRFVQAMLLDKDQVKPGNRTGMLIAQCASGGMKEVYKMFEEAGIAQDSPQAHAAFEGLRAIQQKLSGLAVESAITEDASTLNPFNSICTNLKQARYPK